MKSKDNPFLNHYWHYNNINMLTATTQQRKNKVDIISPVTPVSLLHQLQTVVVHNPNLDKDEGPIFFSELLESQQFEVLLLKFFRISYYVGITPYYLNVVTLENGTRKVETLASGKLHTVLVALIHICTLVRILMLFTILSYNLKNPLNYFEIARTTLSAALCWFFIWTLWMKLGISKQILYRLSNLNYFPNVTMFRLKWVEHTIIIISLLLLYATSIYPAIEECNVRLAKLCREDHQSSLCRAVVSHEGFDYGKMVGKSIFILFNYLGHTTRRYPRMKLLVIALTLWEVCKSFGKSIKEKNRKKCRQGGRYNSHEITKVLDAYEDLKEISNLIRKLVGKMLVTEIVEDILYFSLEVQLRLREADWFSIFVVFETWLVAFLAYFIAACAAEPIQEVSIWLARDDVLSQLSPGKVTTLHSQLNGNPIGLKGGTLFTITKSFLANVVTVWLTYFIILLQFQTTLT